jgi:nucleotide-binding universal stress UspA family protein
VSATSLLFILGGLWAFSGVVVAVVMGRRGHSAFPWFVLGFVLGPLVVPLMLGAIHREQVTPVVHFGHTEPSVESLAVLVGVDASDEAKGALVTAIALFGTRIGRLTIATVLDHDVDGTSAGREAQDRAREMLSAHALLAAGLLDREAETVVLTGRPADALVQHALAGNYQLIVVSPRGKGASRVLFGSVASSLARGVGVPVVILPPARLHAADGISS